MKKVLLLFVFVAVCMAGHAQFSAYKYLQDVYSVPNKIYHYYISNEPDSMYAMASADLASAITEEQLSQQFKVFGQQYGAVREAGHWQTAEEQGYKIYVRRLTYSLYTVDFTVVLDGEKKIAGFFLNNKTLIKTPNELEVTVKAAEGPSLPGLLTLPVGFSGKAKSASVKAGRKDAKVPVAILVHGSGPHDMNETIGPNAPFKDLAEGLSRRGVAVLRYNKRTLQGPLFGQIKNFDTETTFDAMAAIELAKTIPEIDTTRIFVVGHSLGAGLAPRIAEKSTNVRGIVLLAGETRKMPEMIREQLAFNGVGTDSLDSRVNEFLSALPKEYLAFDEQYSPVETAKRLSIPMLILQGERDWQVTMTDLYNWRRALGRRPGVVIKSYPALNHLFFAGTGHPNADEYSIPGQHVAEEVIDDIAVFINRAQ